MKAIRIIASEREYHLTSEERIENLRGAVVAAVRTGGDVVDFTDSSGREISLLVSAGLPLTIEIIDVGEESEEDDHAPSASTAFDYEF
jgi:hypothetical protein